MNKLEKARQIINEVDLEMIKLFKKRMEAASLVASYKEEHHLPVLDSAREQSLKEKNLKALADSNLEPYYLTFLEGMLKASKDYQVNLMTKNYALLGHPLGHSFSPQIHNAIFKELGLNASYILKDIEESELSDAINDLKKGLYHGFNVTIPYKEKIIPYLDKLSDEAQLMKAVNTVVLEDGQVVGYNTDFYGIYDEIVMNRIDVKNKTIYILGTGGASKAVYHALLSLEAKPILVSRSKKDNCITYLELSQVQTIDGIINTTPVGMTPNIYESPIGEAIARKAGFVIDIIFNPRKTKLMSYNENSYNGLDMLIYQAIKAESIWQKSELNKEFLYQKIRGLFNE